VSSASTASWWACTWARLGSRSEASAATAYPPAATQQAATRPSRSDPTSYDVPVTEKNTVPITATPSAAPTCWTVPYVPDAAPASLVGIVASATSTSGTTSRPRPIPLTTSAGTRSHVDNASLWPCTIASTQIVAADCSPAPVTITTLPSF